MNSVRTTDERPMIFWQEDTLYRRASWNCECAESRTCIEATIWRILKVAMRTIVFGF